MVEFFTILALLASFGAFGSFSAHTNIYFMILSFLSSGIVYYLLSATYMAMMLFIVYVGAVAMLFVFCVMLLNLSSKFTRISSFAFYGFLFSASFFLALAFVTYVQSVNFQLDFFEYPLTVKNFTEFVWGPYTKDQLLTFGMYSTYLPYLVFLGLLLFFVTVAVTILLSL